jgi:hypothetical protein
MIRIQLLASAASIMRKVGLSSDQFTSRRTIRKIHNSESRSARIRTDSSSPHSLCGAMRWMTCNSGLRRVFASLTLGSGKFFRIAPSQSGQ